MISNETINFSLTLKYLIFIPFVPFNISFNIFYVTCKLNSCYEGFYLSNSSSDKLMRFTN